MSFRGRPPKPTSLPFPIGDTSLASAPPCPKDLDAVGRKKWKQLCEQLQAAGILTVLDEDLLRDYCLAYSEERAARKELAKDYKGEQFLCAGEHGHYVNPLRHVINKARDQMMRLRAELGLGPVSRGRLGLKKKSEQGGVDRRDRTKGRGATG